MGEVEEDGMSNLYCKSASQVRLIREGWVGEAGKRRGTELGMRYEVQILFCWMGVYGI